MTTKKPRVFALVLVMGLFMLLVSCFGEEDRLRETIDWNSWRFIEGGLEQKEDWEQIVGRVINKLT